jgi:hypothetical protein
VFSLVRQLNHATEGFINRQGELRLEPITGEIEGERRARLQSGGPEYTLIKFKGAQIVPGMSGAPLLNQNTGAICGIVARTLNEAAHVGGLAVPVRAILGGFPFLSERQSAYHRLNQSWRLSDIVFPAPELTDDDKIRALKRLPGGPGVLMAIIPDDVVSRFYALTFTDSTDLIRRANNLRLRTDPAIKPHLIVLLGLPKAENGIIDYWHAAFAGAAARGPRMLAAVLYEAPPGTYDGIEDILLSMLASLKTWPVS